MRSIKYWILVFLVAFTLGYLTRMQVHECASPGTVSSDTVSTDTNTVTTWDFSLPDDTTVSAIITYDEEGELDTTAIPGGNHEHDEKPSTGKNATTKIKYDNGDILEISYSYDKELFDVRRNLAPRPIQTHFITREITTIVPEERAPWDKPRLLFGAGCLTGSVITIAIVKIAIGALQ